LALIINNNKKNPWQAKEKDDAIKNKKRGESGPFILFGRPIEPENLREGDK
jgi:hypothetical protein